MIEYHDKMSNSAAKKGGGFWRTSSSAIPGRPNPSNVEASREQNSTSSVIQTSITAPPASSFKGKNEESELCFFLLLIVDQRMNQLMTNELISYQFCSPSNDLYIYQFQSFIQ